MGVRTRVVRANALALSSAFAAWVFVLMITWPENIVTSLALGVGTGKSQSYPVHWFEIALLSFVVLIVVSAVLLLARRNVELAALAQAGDGAAAVLDDEAPRVVGPRLIFAAPIQGALVALGLVSVVVALTHLQTGARFIPQFLDIPESPVHLMAMTTIAAFIALAPVFRYGAKTLMDIVDHFTVVHGTYPVRARIAARFRLTIDHLLAGGGKTDLVIIAHSQGTIVALDALNDPQFQEKLALRASTVTLVTFGSPLEHIYRHYFRKDYPEMISRQFDDFAARVDFRWTNVYRPDDYVGTYIASTPRWGPTNVALPTGGHVRYWEPQVFSRLISAGVLFGRADGQRHATASPAP